MTTGSPETDAIQETTQAKNHFVTFFNHFFSFSASVKLFMGMGGLLMLNSRFIINLDKPGFDTMAMAV